MIRRHTDDILTASDPIGANDSNGDALFVGDIIEFDYIMHLNDDEPEVGMFEHTVQTLRGVGQLFMSPYQGAYIVHRGSCYPLRRKRFVRRIDQPTEHARKRLSEEPILLREVVE